MDNIPPPGQRDQNKDTVFFGDTSDADLLTEHRVLSYDKDSLYVQNPPRPHTFPMGFGTNR